MQPDGKRSTDDAKSGDRARQQAGRYLPAKPAPIRSKPKLGRWLIILLCLFGYGFFLDTATGVPDNVWVYVDRQAGTYTAPPYLRDSGLGSGGLAIMTVSEAKRLQLKPDGKAKEKGYFRQEGRSLSGSLLEKLHILPPLPPRWNADGTWNW